MIQRWLLRSSCKASWGASVSLLSGLQTDARLTPFDCCFAVGTHRKVSYKIPSYVEQRQPGAVMRSNSTRMLSFQRLLHVERSSIATR